MSWRTSLNLIWENPLLPVDSDTTDHAAAVPADRNSDVRTGRRVRLIAAVVAISLVLAFVMVRHQRASNASELARATQERADAKVPVNAIRVGEAPSSQLLILPGTTAAWYESLIYSRVNGYVARWTANIGDKVHKGQVLATLATPELDAELSAARARAEADQAEVQVRESAVSFTQTTYDRWRDSPKGVVSEQEREAKKADFASAQAQLNAAKARVNLDRAEIERLTALTHFKEVIAPFDGTVIERRIDIGNLVTAGSNASTVPLYKVSQDDPIRIYVEVPQSVADSVIVGTPANIILRDQGDRRLASKVERTSRAVDPVARTVRAEIDLPNANGKLVPGMYVQAEFGLASQGNMQIPAAALVFSSRGPQVAVIGNDGTANFRDVVIARDQGNLIDLSSGVRPGEIIALNLSSQVVSGDKVEARIQSDSAPSTKPGITRTSSPVATEPSSAQQR